MIITIDGPSGTGKTTVAREVAERLHFVYFDTGAMYRAFAWLTLQNNTDLKDMAALERLLAAFDFQITQENGQKHYYTQGHDVTEIIRSPPVTAHASLVAAIKKVREELLHIQHQFAAACDAVFEGRDLGTVVFPAAEIKIFLDADPEVRAERRLAEITQKDPEALWTQERVLADLVKRDTDDSTREVAPLKCPPDAVRIDTAHLSVGEVVDLIVTHAYQKHPELASR